MPYINDIFISYKRGRISEQWLSEIFLPLFEDYLKIALPYDPKIFVDKTGLTPGVSYTNELFLNLFYSKSIVSIWSPPYFRQSEWCVKELLTMKYRQEVWHLGPLNLPKTLIWPIIFMPIAKIPDIVSDLTYIDYSDFNVVGEAFFKTEKYLEFQRKMQKDIKALVEIIVNARQLNPEWETEEGKRKILQNLNEYFETAEGLDPSLKQELVTWSVK